DHDAAVGVGQDARVCGGELRVVEHQVARIPASENERQPVQPYSGNERAARVGNLEPAHSFHRMLSTNRSAISRAFSRLTPASVSVLTTPCCRSPSVTVFTTAS